MVYRYELPSKKVTSIVQDRVGWIWIGTDNGLCRYNGNGFLVFNAAPDAGALENDEINCMFTDGDGTIWYGNQCGIGHSQYGYFVAPEVPLYNRVREFDAVDTLGVVMAERHSILKMTDDFQHLERYISPHLLNPEMAAIPSKKEVWLYNYDTTTKEGEIIVLDSDLHERRRFKAVKPASKLVPNPSGNVIWAFGQEGLSSYNLQTYSPQELPAGLASIQNDILFINTYDGHDFLIGMEKGIFVFDSFSGSVRAIDQTLSLRPDVEYVSFVDRDLNVWLYGSDMGLRFIPSATSRTSVREISDFLPEESLLRLIPDSTDGIWSLSDQGVSRYSQTAGKLVSRMDGDYKEIAVDPSGKIWVCGYDRGLSRYSWDKTGLTKECDLLLREVPRSMAADSEGRVWVAYSNMVQVLDKDGEISLLELDKNVRIQQLYYSKDSGTMFLVGSGDISMLHLNDGVVEDRRVLSSVRFPTSIEETADGKLWIGTISEGLLCYDMGTGEIKKWNVLSGLMDNHVKFLQKDLEGNIWVLTKSSIVRLDVKRDAFNYIQENQLFDNREVLSCCVATDGYLYCAGETGMFRIRPSDVVESSARSADIPIYLDYLKVNGKRCIELKPGVTLVLSHLENMLNMGFSGLKFGYGPFLTYQYRLEGYDQSWVSAYSNSDISYSNLPAGKYNFRARVKNLNGEWSRLELSVPIEIRPAVWATWWAKLIYLLLLMSLTAYVIRLIIRWRLHRERLSLAERGQQLKQDHIDFLVNVSHELRTPLTLITAPLKQLKHSPDISEGDRTLVDTIEKSAGKLEELAEQIMNVGKSSMNSEPPLKVSRRSLNSLVKAIADNFRFIAMDKELQMEVVSDETIQDGYFDSEKLERILSNLVSNAVKYTPAGGSPIRINLGMRYDADGHQLAAVSVEDGGMGIPADKRDEIFNRYERLDPGRFSSEIKGAGIGLNYAQYLATLHHGSIQYSDNIPCGAIFTVLIPYDKASYSQDEIVETFGKEETLKDKDDSVVAPKSAEGSILLVEDNEDVRDYLRQLLSSRYNVTVAVDGVDGWDCLQTGAVPDLVISDVIMPRKDGFELCRDIKGSYDYGLLPVLLLTAKSDLDNHVRGLDCGADAYVAKPFDPFLLLHQVGNLIKGRRDLQHKLASLTSSTIASVTEASDSSESAEESGGESLSALDRKFLERLYKVMDEHLDEQDFNVAQLSEELYMSYSRVYVKIKMLTGEAPLSLLNTYRMNIAMERLKTGKYTVGEVSEMVGASSLANFSRSFKRQFGIPPSQVEVEG